MAAGLELGHENADCHKGVAGVSIELPVHAFLRSTCPAAVHAHKGAQNFQAPGVD